MKTQKIIFWTTTTIIFLMEAVMPLSTLVFAPDQFNVGTKPLGYPDYFAYALIICKALGALALMLPVISTRVKEWAYAGLTFNLLFATYSHLVVDKNMGYIIMPLVVLIILALSYFSYHRLRKI